MLPETADTAAALAAAATPLPTLTLLPSPSELLYLATTPGGAFLLHLPWAGALADAGALAAAPPSTLTPLLTRLPAASVDGRGGQRLPPPPRF